MEIDPPEVYRSKAILPTNLHYGSSRTCAFNNKRNELAHEDMALLHSSKYQQALRRYHDRNVKTRSFNVGNLVLRRVLATKDKQKLSPPWEGPYIISRVIRPGSFKQKTIEGQEFTNAWNIAQLRKFHP